jgi:glycosyltransferase involved in cell wall biosynthesis
MKKVLYVLEDSRFGGMSKMITDLAFNSLPIHMMSKNKKSILFFIIFFIPDIIKLVKTISKHRPDIVYCNGSQHIKAVIAGSLLRKNVIWHMHDTYQPKLIVLLFKIVKTLFSVKNFVASSQRTIEYYNLPRQSTLLSHPPVDTSIFVPSKPKNINENTLTNIISVSNVNPDKGLDTLIRTAAKVNKERKNVTFKVVGLIPETQKDYYRDLIALKVNLDVLNLEFTGQRDDIPKLLSEADIYLCCSSNESGPIAVFEAMSMEIPVVSTDVGDLKHIFAINDSAKVHRVGDSSALANEILALLANPAESSKLAKRGRLTAIEHLDINVSASNLGNFYQKIFLAQPIG